MEWPRNNDEAKDLINRVWHLPKEDGGLDWARMVPYVWKLHQRNVATVTEIGGGNHYGEYAYSAQAVQLQARPVVAALV